MNDIESRTLGILFCVCDDTSIFSIPIQYVASVSFLAEQTVPIPHSPNYVAGIYKFHGQNINVIDLKRLLYLDYTHERTSMSRSLLLISDSRIGLLVDKVLGVEQRLLRHSAGIISPNRLIQSVCSYDGVGDIVLELDIPQLLSICQQA